MSPRRLIARLVRPHEFVDRLSDLSRQLPERTEEIQGINPQFFSESGGFALETVEKACFSMYKDAVAKIVPRRFSGLFKTKIEALKNTPEYHAPATELVDRLAPLIGNPHHADILARAVLNYLSAVRTIAFLNRLGSMDRKAFLRFFIGHGSGTDVDVMQTTANRHEASKHFERFASLYRLANEYKNYLREERRYHRELPVINGLKISGVDHHLLVTEKPSFFSLRPSVYGGDNFHLSKVEGLPEDEELYIFHMVDAEGHSEPDHSIVNNVRNMMMGLDLGTTHSTGGEKVIENPADFLRRQAGIFDDALSSQEIRGYGIFGLIDAKRRKMHYVSMGHDYLTVARPNGRLMRLNIEKNLPLGIGYIAPQDLAVGSVNLAPGMVVKMHTDGINELKLGKSKRFDYSRELNQHFLRLASQGLSAREISEQLIQKAHELFGGRPFSDDGRLFVFRCL